MSCVSSESTKEELVESIRALQKQVAEHALNDSAAHGKMVGLQDLLDEKNEQIRAITEQSIVLSEKVVENEETIGALIRQMEQMRSTLHTDGGTNPDNNKLPFLGEGKVIGVATKEGSRNTPKVMARHDGRSSTGEQAHEVSKGQVIGSHGGSSVTTHTGDDIAAMENKMRELQEVNTLYAAIVSQHDDDDKSRRNISYRSNVATSQDDSDIRNLRERCEQLQRNGDRMASENASVRQVNVSLREENSRLELEMAEMLKWKLSVEANMASSIPIPEAREQPDVLGATEPQSTAVNLIGGAPTCLISPSVATASLPQQLRSLPPISIRHPTTQEQELLKRIDLYTSHIAQRDAYEADRQRSFSEMEAARALLFSNLNEKLTNQREEIKHLQSLNTCQSNVNPDAHVIDDFHQLRASDVACAATSPIKEDSFPVFWANLVNDELMDRLHVELDAADALFHLMTNHPVHLIRWIDDRKPDMERVDPVLTLSSSGEQNTDDHSREGIDECVSCSLIEEKMNLAFDEVLNYFEALVKPLNATKVRSFSGSLMESLYALQSEDREDLLLVRMKAHQRSLDARSPIRSISEIRGEDYVGDFEHMQQQRSLGENRDGVSSCKFASFDTTVENGTPSPPHIVASHCVERSLPSETEELMISPLSETDGAGIRDCQDMTKTDQQHPDRTNCARQGSSLRDQHEVGKLWGQA